MNKSYKAPIIRFKLKGDTKVHANETGSTKIFSKLYEAGIVVDKVVWDSQAVGPYSQVVSQDTY